MPRGSGRPRRIIPRLVQKTLRLEVTCWKDIEEEAKKNGETLAEAVRRRLMSYDYASLVIMISLQLQQMDDRFKAFMDRGLV